MGAWSGRSKTGDGGPLGQRRRGNGEETQILLSGEHERHPPSSVVVSTIPTRNKSSIWLTDENVRNFDVFR